MRRHRLIRISVLFLLILAAMACSTQSQATKTSTPESAVEEKTKRPPTATPVEKAAPTPNLKATEDTIRAEIMATMEAESVQEEPTEEVVPTQEEATEAPVPTQEEPTEVPVADTPAPTAIPEVGGLVKGGTHLVGTDIQPGIYVGMAGYEFGEWCYWARLSNLTGSDDILANDNAKGLFYVEVLPGDKALETACELVPIEQVPARNEFLTLLSPGTYLVGRDIEPGVYRGEAGHEFGEWCYWARLQNVNGDDDILANDNAEGQFFVEVLPTDFALNVGCEVEKVQ